MRILIRTSVGLLTFMATACALSGELLLACLCVLLGSVGVVLDGLLLQAPRRG